MASSPSHQTCLVMVIHMVTPNLLKPVTAVINAEDPMYRYPAVQWPGAGPSNAHYRHANSGQRNQPQYAPHPTGIPFVTHPTGESTPGWRVECSKPSEHKPAIWSPFKPHEATHGSSSLGDGKDHIHRYVAKEGPSNAHHRHLDDT
ncbi:hypothetical protein H0H92_006357 [Tricholoma furcatifolium]|nr:hypothetical protein H0H92_006357 [Tricholoma furcatifolium]